MTGQLDWKELAVFRLKELDLSQCHSIPDWSWATVMPGLEILLLPADVKELAPFKIWNLKYWLQPELMMKNFPGSAANIISQSIHWKINEMVPVSVIR